VVDECATIAPVETDARGVERLSYTDRKDMRTLLLPRFIPNVKREILEKWVHVCHWAGCRNFKATYRMPKTLGLYGTVAGRSKRVISRFYRKKRVALAYDNT